MTNHTPVFTSSSATGSFTETANTTDSTALHLLSGTMNFTDADHSDTHATTATLHSAVLSSGSVIPAASLAHFNSAMTSQILSDHNGSGQLKWSFSDADDDFDFLAKNQTLVLTYDIQVSDNHGGTVTQTVKVTVTGTDDKPVINTAAMATVNEQANHTLSLSPDTVHVALNFIDDDLTNTGHTASVLSASASGVTSGILPGFLGTAELMAFFNVDNVIKAAGSSAGTINTTFTAPDLAFDYLAAGEHLDITYVVQLDDHAGGVSTQNVVVTVIGTNDAPIYISGPESAHLVEDQNVSPAGNLTANGDLFFTDIDLSDTHSVATTVTAVRSGGGAVPLSNAALLAAFVTSVEDSTGHVLGEVDWNFALANAASSFLAGGETLTLTYHVAVNDNHGGTANQDVTITVLGTHHNHPVAITSGPETASVVELDNTTGSAAVDTTTTVPAGTLNFTDADTGDTHTVAVTLGSTSGPAVPAATQADLAAALTTTLHDSTGTGTGSVDWNFNIADKDLDFLAAGETETINYSVKVSDGSTSATQTVSVVVTGSNDAVAITSGPESASVVELDNTTGSAAVDTTTTVPAGTLNFTDADTSDTHTVAVTLGSTSGPAIPAATQADLAAALTTTLHDSTGTGTGSVDWNFNIADKDLDFLAAGETETINYTVKVSDASTNATQTVSVVVTGSNDAVAITSGPESASVVELDNTTGSAAVDTTTTVPAGTLNFTDADTGDTHTVAVTLGSTSGPAIPAATQADLAAALTTTLNDSTGTGTGSVDWNFNIADKDLDFLAAGETETINYTVKVSDASTNATQTVSVVVTGSNDAVAITSGPESASVAEQANTTGSTTPDTATGTLAFADVDLSDSHSVSVALTSAVWSGDPSFVPSNTMNDLQTALTTALHDSTGSGSGGIDWNFSIQDRDIDFLSAGETLTATYDVTVFDGSTSSTQTVTITMTGAQDTAISVNPDIASILDTSNTDDGQVVAVGNLITDAGDSAGDLGNTLHVTDVNGTAVGSSLNLAATYGTLTVFHDGTYIYTANSALDAVLLGQHPTEQFNVTVSDSSGHSSATTLTFNVTGANEAPQITAAQASGSMTEDAGPTILVNGGFETGDLTGWTATGNVSAEATFIGGSFGTYSAVMTGGDLAQDVVTTAGQHYTLSFDVAGDPEASSTGLSIVWDGTTVFANSSIAGAFTHYSFDVVATGPTTHLDIQESSDGSGALLDQVAVEAANSPATETTAGSVSFSDPETGDTHTASFTPQDGSYVGTFSLDPVSETAGSGSVDWHFTVNNSDIQFLSQGQQLIQTYTVSVADEHGASALQDVTVTINGANDAPTAVSENVITDVGAGGTVDIPTWALAANDTDPDQLDHVSVNAVVSSSGGTASLSGDAFFTDDATPGGSFDYTSSDGIATSNIATATVINNATNATTLTGTSGDDILIATNGTETLSGGGGNDVLIGNAGSHVMTGGSGNDNFAFMHTSDGPGIITDFNNVTEQDHIAISASGFGGVLTPGMDVSPLFETSGDSQFSGSAVFHFDSANQTLYYSADGTQGSAITVTTVQAGVVLNGHDLLIV